MEVTLKTLIFALLALGLAACSSTPERAEQRVRLEWDVNGMTPEQVATLKQIHQECRAFAYKAVVQGSIYSESDIANSCVERKGYKTRTVVLQ